MLRKFYFYQEYTDDILTDETAPVLRNVHINENKVRQLVNQFYTWIYPRIKFSEKELDFQNDHLFGMMLGLFFLILLLILLIGGVATHGAIITATFVITDALVSILISGIAYLIGLVHNENTIVTPIEIESKKSIHHLIFEAEKPKNDDVQDNLCSLTAKLKKFSSNPF